MTAFSLSHWFECPLAFSKNQSDRVDIETRQRLLTLVRSSTHFSTMWVSYADYQNIAYVCISVLRTTRQKMGVLVDFNGSMLMLPPRRPQLNHRHCTSKPVKVHSYSDLLGAPLPRTMQNTLAFRIERTSKGGPNRGRTYSVGDRRRLSTDQLSERSAQDRKCASRRKQGTRTSMQRAK